MEYVAIGVCLIAIIAVREMDQIVYPVCTLCRDHERSGFIHGVQVGMRLAEELK